ncbi:CPBP family intramembrane glutamic endopeptidase [uncultured Mycolicibacterium sp.]|uniref:CPBP family intramembrane glutamic endopeptidase n=1 Tax=uncultured Mycolicibacterium sp. TaxID=2320817 RepID=UPI0026031365|nr:CPBP family intramembrane glutamic endopeptidase [uncultured Mycolicibacterium sp.]
MTEPLDEPAPVVRRRRVVVAVVLVVGAALLGWSLTRPPGETSFYWLTLALAAVWAGGALASGPVPLGRGGRPLLLGLGAGVGLAALFVLGGLVARRIDPVYEYVSRVLEFADQGPLLLVAVITVVNGIAEELFFRGALYSALGRAAPVLWSTVAYVAATTAGTGNPMLGFAAALLGPVCALLRRSTGGVAAPVLTHAVWGLTMVLVLPRLF